MTDAETRAEMERIDPSGEFVDMYKYYASFTGENYKIRQSIFPLLAESQKALREIEEDEVGGHNFHCPNCIRKVEIAKNACKKV